MTADIPWANESIGNLVSKGSDVQPEPYSLFYVSMNIGSTYLISLIIIMICTFGVFLGLAQDGIQNRPPLTFVFQNFFLFGVFSCGAASFYGALLNPIQEVSLNSVLYIIGIIVYLIAFIEAIYATTKSSPNFYRIRVLLKASLLSFAKISPIYFFFAAIFVDLVGIVIEYQILKSHVVYLKIWVAKNIFCDIALCLLGFFPGTVLGIVLCSLFIGTVLILDCYVHAK